MRTLLSAILGLAVLTSCGFFEGKDTATKSVDMFHQQYNDESYGDMYLAADADFRRATTLPALAELFQAVHRKLGTFSGATQTTANVFSSGALTTVTLVYNSRFTEGNATEQFKYSIAGGKAFLLAYNINSPTLILK